MSLDEKRTIIFGEGKVTVASDEISVAGFDSVNATCRDVVALALCWAIGELQAELKKVMESPDSAGTKSVRD